MRVLIGFAFIAASAVSAQTEHPPVDTENSVLFLTSDQCIACHSNLTAASGEDVSIGYSWRASMMANSARDPYWHAGVRREVMDHPEAQAVIEDTCSTCHMPMARFEAANQGGRSQVFANLHDPLAMDGVSCTVCHQIRADNFGETESFDGGFVIDTSLAAGAREIFGPHEVDAGRHTLMHSATQFLPTQTTHMQRSELCATCHTLYTRAINASGNDSGEFAEQVPYPEWLHSDFRETRSCQACHMPELDQDTPITSVLGEPRPRFSRHVFRGGNVFMLRVLNKYRDELGVTALPQELSSTANQTEAFLGTEAARLSVDAAITGSTLSATVTVANISGHKLPTAYPSRRVWLHVVVSEASGRVVFESGALRPDGSIVGNDSDADAARFEPHYERIDRESQVQIYEPVLADEAGEVTTGLLSAVRYAKDNRLLPRGFDKQTASWDIAVHGSALEDADFIGGSDRIEYRVDIGAAPPPLTVSVELYYQSIGFRWAENLKSYQAPEPQRFVRYYGETAEYSAVRLAASSAVVGTR
jgi:hypothetical protein